MGEFSSPELTLCADSYLVSIPPLCYPVTHKRPWSLCQKCRWQVTPKHLTPVTQAQSGSIRGNKLTCNSSRNTRPQLSQLTEPLCNDSGQKSGFSMHDLIYTLKKKPTRGMNHPTFSQNLSTHGKSHHHCCCSMFRSIKCGFGCC